LMRTANGINYDSAVDAENALLDVPRLETSASVRRATRLMRRACHTGRRTGAVAL